MRHKLLVLFFILVSAGLQAQNYEIRAINKGNGIVGVEMRTLSVPLTAANYITDLVFGIKWQQGYNVELVGTITTGYNMIKSDVRKQKDGFFYQAFSAANTPYLFPSAWPANTWIEVLSIANTRTGVDTGTFTICEPGFDVTTDPNFGIDLVDYTPVIASAAHGVILPVRFSLFNVASRQKAIDLFWTTASETNNRGFELQRSTLNMASFDSLGWVPGKGNIASPSNYTFPDNSALGGITYYYRLKQVSYDGAVSFSEIKSGRLNDIDNQEFSATPNPATTFLAVTYTGRSSSGKTRLSVIDSKGATVHVQQQTFTPGARATLATAALAQGQYYLIIEQNGEVIYQKPFQKQ